MIISGRDTQIKYISKCWVGKTHDYSMLKEEFPPEQNWFSELKVRVDLGYLGINKYYTCKEVIIAKKCSKLYKLTEDDKAENKNKAKERIYVEHSICGIKRYRILSDRLRIHDSELYDDILEVCSGLWNFYLNYSKISVVNNKMFLNNLWTPAFAGVT